MLQASNARIVLQHSSSILLVLVQHVCMYSMSTLPIYHAVNADQNLMRIPLFPHLSNMGILSRIFRVYHRHWCLVVTLEIESLRACLLLVKLKLPASPYVVGLSTVFQALYHICIWHCGYAMIWCWSLSHLQWVIPMTLFEGLSL